MPFQGISDGTQMSFMELFLRVTLAFWVLLTLTRIMGRKQVSQLTFFDYVTGISIGSIAAVLAVDKDIPLVTGILGLVIWTTWAMILNIGTLKSIPLRKYIDGEPIMVIHNGKILEQNIGSKYYNVNDLMMELRENGVFDPSEVQIGIAEPDGKLSILKKPQLQPITPKDLNIQHSTPNSHLAVGKELIIDGNIIMENLTVNKVDAKWLQQQLNNHGIVDISQIMIATMTPQGTLYIDKKQDYDSKINN
ncbi:DUF421 domain-containing protein [Pelosinus sp. IPA-1]|uniref:DUF421 domain-containing protein n=1 Tax=Pelosinus sp. IPA-1 TaxID=3029569 RepID=UPI0024361BC3|nr:DUF421 domain-containing protein [Pelosinus sp. IPA-1]GMA99325.1 DUF421 domain-containing protein [Pelosinus sp. IPA-1]